MGLAAIQLARYKKADIFVTVGTEEKRLFMSNTLGVPQNRIFSSRDESFAQGILAETNGRGIDLVINSLAAGLQDASWRIVADGGAMVEIGKRDIASRNRLAMEPFSRNCSFHAVDVSYNKAITDTIVEQLLAEVFDFIADRRIQPILPMTAYGFHEIPKALACMRSGQHIGKLVITRDKRHDMQVRVRPAAPVLRLKPDTAYLIVGGMKGLCGSIAIHMARHGARHIIVCNRSGINDETSARVVRDCLSYGCQVDEAKGDVADIEFVKRIFSQAQPKRIAGIVQGAMVLRVSI